jgi:integrase
MRNKVTVKWRLHLNKYILCRVSVNGTRQEWSTGYTVSSPEKWTGDGITGKGDKDRRAANAMDLILDKIEAVPINSYTTAKIVRDVVIGKRKADNPIAEMPLTVIRAMKYHAEAKKKIGEHTFNSIEYYTKSINSFERFLLAVYDITDMDLTDLSKRLIRDYYGWLKGTGVKSEYSRYQYCTAVSTAINFVIEEFSEDADMIKFNIISKVVKRPNKEKMRAESLDNHLNTDDIYTLNSTDLGVSYINGYPSNWWKEMAVFQMLSGFSFIDLGNPHWKIIKGKDIDMIEMRRVKTSIPSYIPVLPELKECIRKLEAFQEKSNWNYLFPIRVFVNKENTDKDKQLYDTEYSHYRRALAKLTELSGIKVKTHALRHTFGMVMINKYNYTTDEVAVMMGHKTSKTTQDNYVRVSADKIMKSTLEKNIQ